MKVFGFAGYSGSGKTTLIEQLIPRFVARGLKVSLIKHAHHGFDIDRPGKDSWRHREAGCSEVLLTSDQRWVLMHELRGERTGIRYALGSRVQVQVSRVDLDGRRIDFRLVTEGEDLTQRAMRDKAGADTDDSAAPRGRPRLRRPARANPPPSSGRSPGSPRPWNGAGTASGGAGSAGDSAAGGAAAAAPPVSEALTVAAARALATSAAAPADAGVLYVAPGGQCGVATPCYASVQAAVDAANPGDEIRVAEGAYTGVEARAGITQTVYISKTVTVRGGYISGNWDSADPVAHPTRLDAQGQGRVVVIGDSSFALNKNLEYVGGEPFEGRHENAEFWRWLLSRVTGQPEWVPPEPPPLVSSDEAAPPEEKRP